MELLINGDRIRVAQAGGRQIIFDEPIALSRHEGQLVVSIDGAESRWNVTLKPGETPWYIVEAEFTPLERRTSYQDGRA